jgi:ABC-type phosphate transport system substrate-binding protein
MTVLMRKDTHILAVLNWQVIICLAGLFLAAANVVSAETSIAESGLAIVVHKDTEVENLTLSELRNIFRANQQFWPNRSRIVLLVRAAQSDERDYVLNRIYEMNEDEFRRYWIAKMFRAEVPRGPKVVFSTGMTLDLVVAIPNSISFMRADNVTDDVKVVRVDGKLPGEDGYPLK